MSQKLSIAANSRNGGLDVGFGSSQDPSGIIRTCLRDVRENVSLRVQTNEKSQFKELELQMTLLVFLLLQLYVMLKNAEEQMKLIDKQQILIIG